MIRYVFREDEPVKIKNAKFADAQAIGEHMQTLTDKAGGALTPKAVVEAAQSPVSPLHPHFEWDDKLAAHAHRLDQARNLIRLVHVVDEDTTEGVARAFLSINAEGSGVSYRPLDVVKKSSDLQLAMLKAAERDLQAFETRYRALVEICDTVRTARQKVSARRSKIENRVS